MGHDLHLKLSTHQLLGIRDLSAAIVFSKMGHKTKDGGQFYKLQTLAEVICNKKNPRTHTLSARGYGSYPTNLSKSGKSMSGSRLDSQAVKKKDSARGIQKQSVKFNAKGGS